MSLADLIIEDGPEGEYDDYDYWDDRICSYPCHICGEEDEEWEDDDGQA